MLIISVSWSNTIPYTLLISVQIGTAKFWKRIWHYLVKFTFRNLQPANFTLKKPCACAPGEMYNNVHSSLIYDRQKLKKQCPTLVKWINKLWYSHTMEHYSTIKRKKNCNAYDNMDKSHRLFFILKATKCKRGHTVWFHIYELKISKY